MSKVKMKVEQGIVTDPSTKFVVEGSTALTVAEDLSVFDTVGCSGRVSSMKADGRSIAAGELLVINGGIKNPPKPFPVKAVGG